MAKDGALGDTCTLDDGLGGLVKDPYCLRFVSQEVKDLVANLGAQSKYLCFVSESPW